MALCINTFVAPSERPSARAISRLSMSSAKRMISASRRPVTQLDDASVLSAPLGTEQLVEGREEVKEVLEGVAKLPEDRREALIMRFALDMDNREIARALGRSEGATKVLIHRAIKQLEESLEGPADE
jgi:RNA polymerase sigma-70 factor, ECF subfamily